MEPLHISGFQPHVQTDARVVARGVKRVQRRDLPTRQPRHPVVVSEPTLRRVDEVPVVYPAEQLALAFTLITKLDSSPVTSPVRRSPSFAPSHTATALPSSVDAIEPCLWNTGMSYVGRLPGGTSPFL